MAKRTRTEYNLHDAGSCKLFIASTAERHSVNDVADLFTRKLGKAIVELLEMLSSANFFANLEELNSELILADESK